VNEREPLRAAYTVPELARMMGLSPWRLTRILQAQGVTITSVGRSRIVFLEALRRAAPDAYRSLVAMRDLDRRLDLLADATDEE
jgi:AraC-like DNA-binding protein